MWVIAQPGQICPKDGAFSGMITDSKPEQVPATRYYSRLIADGSLRELTDAQAREILSSYENDTVKKSVKGSKQ